MPASYCSHQRPSEAVLGFCYLDCWKMRVEAINEMHGEDWWENRCFGRLFGTSCIRHWSLNVHMQCGYSKVVPITTCFYYIEWCPPLSSSHLQAPMWFLYKLSLLQVILRRQMHFFPSLRFVTLQFSPFIRIRIEGGFQIMGWTEWEP